MLDVYSRTQPFFRVFLSFVGTHILIEEFLCIRSKDPIETSFFYKKTEVLNIHAKRKNTKTKEKYKEYKKGLSSTKSSISYDQGHWACKMIFLKILNIMSN